VPSISQCFFFINTSIALLISFASTVFVGILYSEFNTGSQEFDIRLNSESITFNQEVYYWSEIEAPKLFFRHEFHKSRGRDRVTDSGVLLQVGTKRSIYITINSITLTASPISVSDLPQIVLIYWRKSNKN
jgi:hypothetical protein